MTVEEAIRGDLHELGLTRDIVDEIIPEVKRSLIGTKFSDDTSGYPEGYTEISIIAARATTKRWLRENRPKHFVLEVLS